MAKTIADYMILSDGAFEIDSVPDGVNPVAKNLHFDLPNDFVVGTNRAKPILQFIFAALSTQSDSRFAYWINVEDTALVEGTRAGSHFWPERVGPEISTWEALSGELFRPGESNRLRFGFPPGWRGTARIRDVVLWYQRRID